MNISRSLAGDIALRACNKSFNEARDAEAREEADLAEACWRYVFKGEAEVALSLPRKWVRYDTCLRFNVAGWNVTLKHPAGFPVPGEDGCRLLGPVTGELASKVREFLDRRQANHEKRGKVLRDLIASVHSARTLKRLAESWPEGREFYQSYISADKKTGTAIAIPFKSINEALGIKKETSE